MRFISAFLKSVMSAALRKEVDKGARRFVDDVYKTRSAGNGHWRYMNPKANQQFGKKAQRRLARFNADLRRQRKARAHLAQEFHDAGHTTKRPLSTRSARRLFERANANYLGL